jgi:hypothetical protein
MKRILSFVVGPALSSAAFSRDFRPETHFENITTASGSVLQCVVFPTTPGVMYSLEITHDLVNWTTQNEIYGLGHDYVVTMRETAAAPPPEPDAPPVTTHPTPTKCASIRMQPSSGSGKNCCIIDGDCDSPTYDIEGHVTGYALSEKDRSVNGVMNTIAHEIGHIMTKDGHPDQGEGPAVLLGTDRPQRMLSRGPKRKDDAFLLVKGEWNRIEIWLKKQEDDGKL